jgi:diaminopimelate decarboxylase
VRPWLSFKTHPLPALADQWKQTGLGVEVVSEAELATLLARGFTADGLLVNGVAKHSWLARYPIDRLRVHFDSLTEVRELLPLALSRRWRIGVRCQVPDERDAREASFAGQFGMVAEEAIVALRQIVEHGGDLASVHFHLGQSHQRRGAYERAVRHVAEICRAARVQPRALDLGGGLPSDNDANCDDAFADLSAAIRLAPREFGCLQEIWLENGRWVSDAATVLAVRVIDLKERHECRYAICDGGRTNQALAADHGPHPLLTMPMRDGPLRLTTVCGPTCMTDDRLGRWELPESLAIGDVVIWPRAGAYHLPWENRFSHGLCAIAWCDADESITIVRQREAAPSVPHELFSDVAHV